MKEEFQLICQEGSEALRDKMIAVLTAEFGNQAVIIPGVIKRPK